MACLPMVAPFAPFAPFALLALLAAPHCRAEWKVTPRVDLRETYTDNVRLETNDAARGAFVTDLTPSLSIASDHPRLKLNATFGASLYAYSNDPLEGSGPNNGTSNTSRSQRNLTGSARAKLIEEVLFFDANASIGQQNISAFGPQVGNNSNGYLGANRAQVSTYRISPYLAHRFGNDASAELRYTRDSLKSGNVGLGDSTGNSVSMSLASGAAFRTLGWGIQLSRQDVEDSLARASRSETASATLRWRVQESLSVNANGGYDKYDYAALGGTTAGKSYSLGATWTPSARTSVQVSAGRRYFGASYSLVASHRSRYAVWSANYSDAVTTTRAQFLLPATINTAAMLDRLFIANFPNPVERAQAVDAYIRATGLPASLADNINYFTNRFVLQKQVQLAAAFNSAKTTTVFSLSATKRQALSTQQTDSTLLGASQSSLNDNTRQAAASAVLNYRISARSGATVQLTKSRTDSLSTGLSNQQNLVSLAVTRQLQRKLKGALELRRAQGNALSQGGRTYRENAVSASLSLTL
ncbi:MAG: TIGR03016 family PEP-CTERM system-associated outer membrane protein [Massilia sp.]|nr:TIGR03016 family PEP-CTERM system-associated outer membrane protein [Massilia sp.]